MKICRSDSRGGSGLLPRAASVLAAAQNRVWEYAGVDERPPLGAYVHSLHQVLDRFGAVLDEVEKLYGSDISLLERPSTWSSPVIRAHESLLFSLLEHFDDQSRILQAYVRPAMPEPAKAQVTRAYVRDVREIRSFVGKIVNAIKHRQRRLRGFAIVGDYLTVPGYFVEGVLPDGTIAPDPLIHEGGQDAFTFATDLRLLLADVFITGECLAEALSKEFAGGRAGACAEAYPDIPIVGERMFLVAERCSKLPPHVFPWEMSLQFAEIGTRTSNGSREITVEFPATRVHVVSPGRGKTIADAVDDGASTQYRPPTMETVKIRRN